MVVGVTETVWHNARLQESLTIISQLVEGVHYIHKAGFVHRDLTRSNIFFDENNIQIGDFGLGNKVYSII